MAKFAYMGNSEDLESWKLPIHDENHVRNAMARFGQTGLPADKKKEVARRIVRAAKAHGIDTSGFEQKYLCEMYIACLPTAQFLSLPVVRDGKQLFEAPIAVTGAWVKGKWKFSIRKEDLADIVRNFEKRKNEQVVIDYEHASEVPELARGGPIPAAGWIHELKLVDGRSRSAGEDGDRLPPTPYPLPEGTVLYALIEWTPRAQEMIRGGEYRFFSPAIDWGAKDKETGEPQGATLTSGALTNHPFLEELPPIRLADHDKLESGDLIPPCGIQPRVELQEMAGTHQDGFQPQVDGPAKRENTVDGDRLAPTAYNLPKGGNAMKKIKLMKIAGMAGKRRVMDDAGAEVGDFDLDDLELDDAEVAAMMERRGKTMTEDRLPQFLTDLGSDESQISTLKCEIQATRKRALLGECVKDGRIDLDRAAELADAGRLGFADYRSIQKAQEAVERAIRDGKFAPADREYISRVALADAARFEEWSKKKPAVVPLGPPTGVTPLSGVEGATPDQELSLRLAQLMSEKNIPRKAALEELARTEPELVRRWRQIQ